MDGTSRTTQRWGGAKAETVRPSCARAVSWRAYRLQNSAWRSCQSIPLCIPASAMFSQSCTFLLRCPREYTISLGRSQLHSPSLACESSLLKHPFLQNKNPIPPNNDIWKNNQRNATSLRIAGPPAPGKTRAAPQAGLPVSHACHSGPARGPRGLRLGPIDALASMSPPSHMFHSCPQNV